MAGTWGKKKKNNYTGFTFTCERLKTWAQCSSWALLWRCSLGRQEETGGREGEMPTQGLAPTWVKDCLSLHIEPWITQTPVFLSHLEIIAVVTQVRSLFMFYFRWTIFGSLNYSLYLNTETLVSGAWVLDRGGQRLSQYTLLASVISLYPSTSSLLRSPLTSRHRVMAAGVV